MGRRARQAQGHPLRRRPVLLPRGGRLHDGGGVAAPARRGALTGLRRQRQAPGTPPPGHPERSVPAAAAGRGVEGSTSRPRLRLRGRAPAGQPLADVRACSCLVELDWHTFWHGMQVSGAMCIAPTGSRRAKRCANPTRRGGTRGCVACSFTGRRLATAMGEALAPPHGEPRASEPQTGGRSHKPCSCNALWVSTKRFIRNRRHAPFGGGCPRHCVRAARGPSPSRDPSRHSAEPNGLRMTCGGA